MSVTPPDLSGGTVTEITPGAAEPGTSASEWKVLLGGFLTAALALLVSFGVNLSDVQRHTIETFAQTVMALGGAYIVSRGIRKLGTPG